jgi:hypothetical protein
MVRSVVETPELVVIPKEKAVFWLDRQGRWHNRHGRFEHKKIINYFHSCIRKDVQGYHLYQHHGRRIEKVYFPYEDTALFVWAVSLKEPITLALNTGRSVFLKPDCLFEKNDALYVNLDGETAKFAEHALIQISSLLLEGEQGLSIRMAGRTYPIRGCS